MTLTILPILVFLTVSLGLAGAGSLWFDFRPVKANRLNAWLDEHARRQQRERVRASMLFKNLGPLGLNLDPTEERPPNLRQRFTIMVEQSGVPIAPRQLLGIAIGFGLAAAIFTSVLRQSIMLPVGVGLITAWLPIAYVGRRRDLRRDQMELQLPDILDMMARVLRAGSVLTQALQTVATEFAPPLRAEFSYCYEQQHLGLSLETALRDLARRTGLLELKVLVTATLVQQRTGGNLAELLDRIAAVARERLRMRTRVKTMTSEGRLQAVVLLGLPPVMFAALWFLKPEYASRLVHHPWLLHATVAAQVLGALWIRSIVKVKW